MTYTKPCRYGMLVGSLVGLVQLRMRTNAFLQIDSTRMEGLWPTSYVSSYVLEFMVFVFVGGLLGLASSMFCRLSATAWRKWGKGPRDNALPTSLIVGEDGVPKEEHPNKPQSGGGDGAWTGN